MTNLLFEPPFGGLRCNIQTSSIARWKASGRLLIHDNWTFFAISYGWVVISRYWSKSALFRGGVTLSANFRWKGASPPTIVGIRKLECFCYLIHLDRVPACDGQTDGRTELPYVLQRSALQAMRPRCKNLKAGYGPNQPMIFLYFKCSGI